MPFRRIGRGAGAAQLADERLAGLRPAGVSYEYDARAVAPGVADRSRSTPRKAVLACRDALENGIPTIRAISSCTVGR